MNKRESIVFDIRKLILAIQIALVSIIFIEMSVMITIRILFLLNINYIRYRDSLIIEYYLLKVEIKL